MYLVEGKDKALLIDTGIGVGRLSEFIKTLTRLPVIVVNTHGHPDHAGSNNQFKAAYAQPLEFAAIKQMGSSGSSKAFENAAKGASPEDMVSAEEASKMPPAELLPLKDHQVFDLGGRKIEVIETPGHTPGEIVLLDSANKLVFTGDNDNVLVWLFLPTCAPLEVYLESLKKLQKRAREFDTILPGHGAPLDAAFLREQIACAASILSGACAGEPYRNPFGIAARNCSFTRASIAFDPKKLR